MRETYKAPIIAADQILHVGRLRMSYSKLDDALQAVGRAGGDWQLIAKAQDQCNRSKAKQA